MSYTYYDSGFRVKLISIVSVEQCSISHSEVQEVYILVDKTQDIYCFVTYDIKNPM